MQDFARNFILNFQEEPKDLHWDHDQVTVHPTVIYRCCLTEGCDELVTEEIIHDPLTIKNFEEDVEFHLRSKNICYEEKFIWTNQAPTQYKSCHVFEGIANSSTCITHHYFPVCHGKNLADVSSGCFKRKFIRYKKPRGKAIRVAQELFEFAVKKLNTEETEEGKCLHYWTRIKYFENITRGQINESKIISKMHELHSIRSIGVENVVQTRNTVCCCLNCITGMGKCEFFEIAGQWKFHFVVGEAFLRKPKINPAHRKIDQKGPFLMNKYESTTIGWVNLENQKKQQIRKNQKKMMK